MGERCRKAGTKVRGKQGEKKTQKRGERKTKRKAERAEVSPNWESITEARAELPLSVSRKHTEMCSSAEAL